MMCIWHVVHVAHALSVDTKTMILSIVHDVQDVKPMSHSDVQVATWELLVVMLGFSTACPQSQ